MVDRDEVMRWVAGYERAWRDGDLDAVAELFTEDARYRPSPYDEAEVGHAAIRAFWLEDQGETFTVRAEPVAVEGRQAVVRLERCTTTPPHEGGLPQIITRRHTPGPTGMVMQPWDPGADQAPVSLT